MLKIARRGASGYYPENTITAFEKALEIDCDVVEFDIHKTKDSHIIIMHDHTVSRTTDGLGHIRDLTLRELKNFHEPNGESIPTLQGVFDLLKNKKKMMLDVKDKDMEREIVQMVTDNDLENDVIIDSDIEEVVEKIKKIAPNLHVYLGGTTEKNHKEIIKRAKQIGAEMIKVWNKWTDKALVEEAHKNNIGVYVWGAEEVDEIKKMLKLGVDAIVCEFPDRIPGKSG